MSTKHKTHSYLLSPNGHPVSVIVVGTGGTGSHLLNVLARIHIALVQLDHPGLFVIAFDDDVIEAHNVGRQNFSHSQVGYQKASELITSINRFYGTGWIAEGNHYDGSTANIIITCTDTIKSRKEVAKVFYEEHPKGRYGQALDMAQKYYWMDIGNGNDFGQIVLADWGYHEGMPGLFQVHPELAKMKDKKNRVTCSMQESLKFQDLFINSIMAQYAGNMLWTLFNKLCIDYHALYINLRTLQTFKKLIK